MTTTLRYRAAALVLAAAAALSACGGGDATAPPSGDPPAGGSGPRTVDVTLDDAHSARVRISARTGGTVTAIGADGSRFTLEIPAGALLTDTTIALTPVSSLKRLPFTRGGAVAAQFGPDGLRLYAPARLTIEPAHSIALNEQVAFAYQGSGTDLFLAPLAADPTKIQLLVEHFSGGGVAGATAEEVTAQLQDQPASAQSRYEQQIAQISLQARASGATSAQLATSLTPIFQAYYQGVVVPAMAGAVADPARIGDFAVAFVWLGEVRFWNLDAAFQSQRQAILAQFQTAISNAVNALSLRCLTQNDTTSGKTIRGLIESAQQYGFQPPAGLDAINTCLVASLELSAMVSSIKVGQAVALTVVARDGDGTRLTDVVVAPPIIDPPTVATGTTGGVVIGTAPGTARIAVRANGVASNWFMMQVDSLDANIPDPNGACGGALGANGWRGDLTFVYDQTADLSLESTLDVHEQASLQVKLEPGGSGWGASLSLGTLAGSASMSSKITTVAHDGTRSVTTYVAEDGAPLTSQNGLPLSAVTLSIDRQTCTYTIGVTAWRPVTVTEGQLPPTTGPSIVGAMRVSRPTNGFATISGSAILPAHSIAWLDEDADAYFPSGGFPPGILLFNDTQSAVGTARVTWTLTPY